MDMQNQTIVEMFLFLKEQEDIVVELKKKASPSTYSDYLNKKISTIKDLRKELQNQADKSPSFKTFKDDWHRINILYAAIKNLQKFKESHSYQPIGGVIGNLLGLCDEIKQLILEPRTISKAQQIVQAYESDPVIAAYLSAKLDWQNDILELKQAIKKAGKLLSNIDND